MNVSTKKYVVTSGGHQGKLFITDKKTNETKLVKGEHSLVLSNMHERTFDRKCETAMQTGTFE